MFKLKIENIGLLVGRQNVSDVDLYTRPNARFGVDSNFKKLYIDHKDTRISIQEDLGNFIDGS
jgi:hypothetical protein